MILVIGGTSFIGFYLINQLVEDGYKVITTGRNKKFEKYYQSLGVEFINFDLSDESDYEKLPKKDIEAVVLLAGLLPANSSVDITKDENAEDYIKVNTIGTALLLKYCFNNGINKMISTTSYADVLHSWDDTIPVKDDVSRGYDLEGDHAAYVISKNAATDLMLYYNNQHGMNNCIFRLPPVYGFGPHGSIHVDGVLKKSGIQVFIDKAEMSETITIHGDGQLNRDVVYVKDVVQAIQKAATTEKAKGVYNITSGIQVSLIDQAKAIVNVFSPSEMKSSIILDPSKKLSGKSYIFDINKAKQDFEYKPQFREFDKMMIDYKNMSKNTEIRELFNL